MRRSRFLRTLLVGLLMLLAVTPTFADPANNPKVFPFPVPLTCGGQEVTVITLDVPNGVGWVTDGTGVTLASQVSITTTFTEPGTGDPVSTTETLTFAYGHGQAQGIQDDLITCTATVEVEDPDVGTVTLDFVVTLFATPRR